MCSYKKYLQWALGILFAMLQGLTQAAGYVDVLDLPARASALAVSSPLSGLARAGDRLVAVGQRGHILYSDDSGKHWQQAAVPVSADLTAVNFPSALQGWAVGNDGVVLHSSDAGATWRKQLDGRQIGVLLVQHYGALARAEPSNEQWPLLAAEGQRLVEQGADKPLLDVWFANDHLGYVVGVFNLILRTEDGGRNWTAFQDRTDNPQGFHLNAIASTGDGVYIAGEQGLLLKWDEAQQRFVAVQTPYQGSFFGVLGKRGEVIAYGLRGNVLRSTDGGLSWTALDSGLHVSITAGFVDTNGHYRLFTQGGQRLVSQGAGADMRLVRQPEPSPVAGAAQAADGALVVVGSRGAQALPKE
ncbi:glycosyl hydrolase [Pseudomonas sp. FW306-02-F02-AA]|uniref:Glycosyl hydrolase n=1 Tax=Pseudomonas fluorescens TaxID=294 RepID=A0A0N9VXX2_PSEFL|nr:MULTISPECIES: YCF48-related protein [Pseudomonas]ALI03433.1 glycosyl hydrolase [Pseudomonas fluorescens]PMZ03539.1 glycosyl hydrolase [Pseudomonas sp. FW306-02-F02-AB]PMZ09694.1 glycosyl hydrolase [Pseudomonas sp. FW306-02-H06C]PMZ15434.1 glycosyl hydrolase [Pseudomonas sp. FW306-02-F02-AA]PMZ21203.1 glycosyl hydrolase [Pseudomonas sp. FW306-02-F08-AA]